LKSIHVVTAAPQMISFVPGTGTRATMWESQREYILLHIE